VTRPAALGVALLLVLSGGWATWFWARLPGRLPSDHDYRRANEAIAARARPGDVIVLAPAWAERGRAFLTAAPVEAGYDLARDEHPGAKRLWLVALTEAPRFDLEAARGALAARGPSVEVLKIGALWLELFDAPGSEVSFSLTESLASAVVSNAGDRGETCRHDGAGRHQCSHADWNHVQAGWHEVDERPLRCVWAHPVDEGPLEVRFEDVPLRGTLHVRAAMTDAAASFVRGAPVTLAVRADEAPIGRLVVENRPGVQRARLKLEGLPERGAVTFSVSTPASALRHFCFDAWLGP
jgi:hypothetical protein